VYLKGIIMKTCFKCNKEKELSEFYVHPKMADGHLGKCKQCAKDDVSENRAANLERIRAYDRERGKLPHRKQKCKDYAQSHPEVILRCTRNYRKKYPTKYLARNLLNNAVRDGRLKKPNKCSKCGKKGMIHGHHEDYYKPLDVVWLCPVCHKKRHKPWTFSGQAVGSSSRPPPALFWGQRQWLMTREPNYRK